jgi:hypothetical protein
MRIRL